MYRSKLARALALTLLALTAAANPGRAQTQTGPCPQIEPYLSIASIGGTATSGGLGQPDQASINVGTCVSLRLVVVRQSGSTITSQDVTNDPNTTFFTSPSRGTFSGTNGSVWCATAAECNLEFPIYGQYVDPCTHTIQRDTVHIHVNRCPPTALLAFTGCPSTATVVSQTGCSGTFPSGVTIPVASGGSGTITTSFNVTGATTATGLTLAQLQALSFNVGTSTVTEVATAGGETISCTFLSLVVTRPTLVVTCPGTQNLGTACTATLPGGLTFPTTGACGAVTLSFGVSGATTGSNLTLAQLLALSFNPGTSTVTVTATTTTGQSATCSFSVTLTRPTLAVTCPGTQNLAGSGANCTATLPTLTFPITGACGAVTTSICVTGATTGCPLTPAQLAALAFNAGTSTVTVTATTSTGQTATCSFSVVVSPATTLAVTCPANQTLTGSSTACTATLPSGLTFPTTGACGAVTLSFGVSGATTASGLTQAQLGALAFNAGTSTVTATATTAAGQTATCSFTVTVRPPAPTISCPPSFTVCVPAGSCTASVTISPTVTPPCATTTTIVATLPGGGTITVPAGTALTLPFGLTTITATATNVTGTASCTTSVLVVPTGQIEISATVAGSTGSIGTVGSDQITIHVGGTITVGLTIGTPGCSGFSAVQAGLASFGVGTNLNVGSFSGNVFTAGAGAANKQFPIYARFFNPCTGLTYTDTIHVTVRP